jgi:hypothetical protein
MTFAMGRNQNIEIVRIIAAFGIVLFHSRATGSDLGYSGLVAFTILSTFFAGTGTAKLAKRVLVPWVFWSVFYAGWRFAADGSMFHAGLTPLESILFGTHLWFLPFIFVINAALGQIKSRHLPLICAIAGSALLAATPWWRDFQLQFNPPVVQYLHALPAALIGVALRTKASLAISCAGVAVCLAWQIPGVSLPYALGGLIVIVALLVPKVQFNVESVSACMFGVYLVHIAALGVFNRITGPATLLTVCMAFFGSLIGVWLARKYVPATRTVLG